jgi:hypothetical protein
LVSIAWALRALLRNNHTKMKMSLSAKVLDLNTWFFIFALQHTVVFTGGTLRRLAICHTNNSPKHFKRTYMIYDRYMQPFADCN